MSALRAETERGSSLTPRMSSVRILVFPIHKYTLMWKLYDVNDTQGVFPSRSSGSEKRALPGKAYFGAISR
uniref:Uncharacterized protein n=1 Tax=Candidatus Kentrum sp. TUN TaxID=2126343 RepID=A0A451AIG0_9GAMM|nr:MAG: hypothetical protein BECKTUN1418D_GA0071000_13782 [Candidatus Kentron sp. TUN]